MSNAGPSQDPLDFVKNMWSSMGFHLPGMVTPTLDVNELDKRIADLKAVEGWLKMNLNMLQMSIQGLEMQRLTLAAVQSLGQSSGQGESGPNPFASAAASAAMWPWSFLQQATAAAAGAAAPPSEPQEQGAAPKPSGK
jgi:hypothetical protein